MSSYGDLYDEKVVTFPALSDNSTKLIFVGSSAILGKMAKHTETVMVRDGGRERAVRVTVDAPNPESLDVQHLAQMAWFQPRKKIKAGDVTVTVQKFER